MITALKKVAGWGETPYRHVFSPLKIWEKSDFCAPADCIVRIPTYINKPNKVINFEPRSNVQFIFSLCVELVPIWELNRFWMWE